MKLQTRVYRAGVSPARRDTERRHAFAELVQQAHKLGIAPTRLGLVRCIGKFHIKSDPENLYAVYQCEVFP